MPIDVNGYNAQFRNFVDFANEKIEAVTGRVLQGLMVQ